MTLASTPKFPHEIMMAPPTILLVEDDGALRTLTARALRQSGFNVLTAATGAEMWVTLRESAVNLVVLDIMLPGTSGFDLFRRLRRESDVPIIFVSARGSEEDRVLGLELGADDYLAKPFAPSELAARVEALGRRVPTEQQVTVLKAGDLEMNLLTRKVTRAGQKIDLQPREFRLLEYLMRHAGQVVTRTMLLEKVWDYNFDPQTNVIDVHISRLRAKIDKEFEEPLLHTVRGAGYRLQG